MPAPPKTLLQKTRSDAARMQKGIYGAYRTPPIPTAVQRVLPSPASAKILPSPPLRALSTTSATSGSRVTVTAVNVRRNSTTAQKNSPKPVSAIPEPHHAVATHSQDSPDAKRQRTSFDSSELRIVQAPKERAVPFKPPSMKKDPKTCLFIPKHRVSPLSATPGVQSK